MPQVKSGKCFCAFCEVAPLPPGANFTEFTNARFPFEQKCKLISDSSRSQEHLSTSTFVHKWKELVRFLRSCPTGRRPRFRHSWRVPVVLE